MQAYFESLREYDKKIQYLVFCNEDCEAHFHENVEVVHLISGCLDITVRGVKRRLFPGDTALVSPYEPHSYVTVGSSEWERYLFPAKLIPQFTDMMKDNMPAEPMWEHSARTQEMLKYLELLKPYADRELSLVPIGYMCTVLGVFVEEVGLVPKKGNRESELLLQKILVYIEDHYREALALSDLADAFGYHKDYLSKMFNACVGCGFNHYVNLLRARYAHKLLTQSDKSLDEILAASGFQSMKTFRRAFSEHYGITPYEFHRSLGKESE
ncbi:MAG: helix-turn-helix domain-containing protein [Clostridia bacterium]|nr:helix-turn-helix domain-containing protein [Clostridia bacterium]